MSQFKNIIRSFLYYFYWLLPKFNYAVVYGTPDFEDMGLALQAGLNQTTVRKVILFVTDSNQNPGFELAAKTVVVRKNTLRGVICFLFARYVFFTHRCFMFRFPPNVVSINVWHGMPIKKIGKMLAGNRGYDSTYSLATSEFWADIIQKSLEPEKTLVAGLPRNDRLFLQSGYFREQLGLPTASDCPKIIAWLPTFRKSIRGELRLDGNESGNVFGLNGITAQSLNAFFKEHNAFVIVKPHPMALCEKNLRLSNLLIVDDAWLRARCVSLYELLGQCDALVSDISSVVVDYLLLNRPVIHLIPDLKEYGATRGFSFTPVTDYLVGPTVSTIDELFGQLKRVLAGEDAHAEHRLQVQKIFLKNVDNRSTERLLKELHLLPETVPVSSPRPAPAAGLLKAAWQQLAFSLVRLTNLVVNSLQVKRKRRSMWTQFRKDWTAVLANSLLLAAIIIIHFECNRHLSFIPLYLIPCVLLAIKLDERWGSILAVCAAIIPPWIHYVKDPAFLPLGVASANTLMRLILFQIIVLLVTRIRNFRVLFRFTKADPDAGLINSFQHHWAIILLSGLFQAGVACLDFFTSPQLNLMPMYLLPGMVMALTVNRSWGTIMAVVAAIVGPLMQRHEDTYYAHFAVESWNTIMRFIVFESVVIALNHIRREDLQFFPSKTGTSQLKLVLPPDKERVEPVV